MVPLTVTLKKGSHTDQVFKVETGFLTAESPIALVNLEINSFMTETVII